MSGRVRGKAQAPRSEAQPSGVRGKAQAPRSEAQPSGVRGKATRAAQTAAALLAGCALLGAAGALERGDRASRVTGRGSASEYWDLMARFESGHRLFARFLITNEGPGNRTAIAYGHLLHPDGTASRFRNGRRWGDWTLSPDGLTLDVGSSLLDQHQPEGRLEIDSDKQGVKIYLRFASDGPATWRDDPALGDYRVDLLDLATPVEGTIWVRGMAETVGVRGRIGITHTWMEQSESDLALRRIEFFSLGDGARLYVSDVTAPSGRRSGWLALERDGEVIQRGFEMSLDERAAPAGERYPLPSVLRLRGDDLEGELHLGRTLLDRNPLEDLPQPFRFLLSLKMSPRRVWTESTFEVTFAATNGQPALTLRGSGVTTVTFLNPPPSSM
ncbi:MAG: hypothetical protein V3U03_03300 [Myxococcota bacterium]